MNLTLDIFCEGQSNLAARAKTAANNDSQPATPLSRNYELQSSLLFSLQERVPVITFLTS